MIERNLSNQPSPGVLEHDVRSHALLAHVSGSVGAATVKLGEKGKCRYCGCDDPRGFRAVAHTMPEALGNKWIVSLDECDACNQLFSRYDDALAKSIGAVLSIGGTPGKGGKVRQTGRTRGPASIRHQRLDGRRRISMATQMQDASQAVQVDPATGEMRFVMQVPSETFIPRYAYKSLVKIATALLPAAELANFSKLRGWLLEPDDGTAIPGMLVGLSFGSLGNAPPVAAIALLKRVNDDQRLPYMIFVMSIGSICFQLDLKSDACDGVWPPVRAARSGLLWTSHFSAPGDSPGGGAVVKYGEPAHFDWSALAAMPTPIEAIVTDVQTGPRTAQMHVVLRGQC